MREAVRAFVADLPEEVAAYLRERLNFGEGRIEPLAADEAVRVSFHLAAAFELYGLA